MIRQAVVIAAWAIGSVVVWWLMYIFALFTAESIARDRGWQVSPAISHTIGYVFMAGSFVIAAGAAVLAMRRKLPGTRLSPARGFQVEPPANDDPSQ